MPMIANAQGSGIVKEVVLKDKQVSRRTDGTADEKDANVTHNMKGNCDNDNKGGALRPIRMNEKGTGKDGEDG